MKRIRLIALVFAVVVVTGIEAGDTKTGFVSMIHKGKDGDSKYVVFVPHGYKADKEYPLILFLHGAGERGDDGMLPVLQGIANAGIKLKDKEKNFGIFVVFPQARVKGSWKAGEPDADRALAILDEVQKAYKIDTKRLYLTGLSMGGSGTWSLAAAHPDKWAAIAPICGSGKPENASIIKDIPTWAFCGDQDSAKLVEGNRTMIKALQAAGGKPRYSEYPYVGHNSWDSAYATPELYTWFLKQSTKGEAKPDTKTGFLNKIHKGADGESKYVVFVPPDYKGDKEYPVILFLHGAGSTGDDGQKQAKAGIAKAIRDKKEKFPFIVVMPQAKTKGWKADNDNGKRALAILDEVQRDYRTDKKRVYLTGLSMGGAGTWSFAAAYPERFAAIAPICGGGDPTTVSKFKDLPCWCFHGDADPTVPVDRSRVMIEALKKAGGNPKYTEYPGVDHNSWDRAYGTAELYTWFLQYPAQPAGAVASKGTMQGERIGEPQPDRNAATGPVRRLFQGVLQRPLLRRR